MRFHSISSRDSAYLAQDRRRIRRYGSLAARLALIVISAVPCANAQEIQYAQGPTDIVRVARPTVLFRFQSDKMPGIPKLEMYLNERPVAAEYDPIRSELRFTPIEPLSPDQYAVKCRVKYEGYQAREYSWKFVVNEDAPPTLPEPSEAEQHLCDTVNAYRRKAGLPHVRHISSLSAAASAHARYLDRNNEADHREHREHYLFIAETPQDRALAFGFADECNEDLQSGCATVEEAVRMLFDAPYHRALILRVGDINFGAGREGTRTVLMFGPEKASGVVVYPADGQRDVPLSWAGPETPNPLRIHGTADGVGYVITYMYSAPTQAFIRVETATLSTESGAEVPVYINRPTNDDRLSNGVFLIPRQPLEPGTTYVAAVRATTTDGKDISRTWRFTTEAVPVPPPVAEAGEEAPVVDPMVTSSTQEARPAAPPERKTCRVEINEMRKTLADGSRQRTIRIVKMPESDTAKLMVKVFDQSGEEVLHQEFTLAGDEQMDVAIASRYSFPRIKVWWVPGAGQPNEVLFDKAYQPAGTP